MSNLWQLHIREALEKADLKEAKTKLQESVVKAVGFWRKGWISDKEFQEFLEFSKNLGCENGLDLMLD